MLMLSGINSLKVHFRLQLSTFDLIRDRSSLGVHNWSKVYNVAYPGSRNTANNLNLFLEQYLSYLP